MKDTIKVKGFFRTQIVDKKTKKIVGDSGWSPNTVTNNGLNDAIAGACIGAAGSYQGGYLALGTQSTAVDATQTDLEGRILSFKALDASTVATGTARATCTFDGADHASTHTIGTIGMFKTSTAGSMIAGQTFTTSQYTSEQDVNATYELRFS